jgi:hypothetical protein
VSAYDALAGLGLRVEGLSLERRTAETSSGFTRVTTTVALAGAGHEGRGEDVSYEAAEHDGYPEPDLAGVWTLASLSARLDGVELWPGGPPRWPPSVDYRRWAFESAALDLALRQAGTSLGEALGRPYRPIRFVVSTRLDPRAWLAVDPTLEFKLDPTVEWEPAFIEAVAATGRVRVLDLKAFYVGTVVDAPPDPQLYRACVELFPDAVIEDAALTEETTPILEPAYGRLSFDAPIHAVADVEALPVPVRHLNIKPSRFGTLRRLFDCLAWCEAHGVAMYGGGQFELGYGRGQIQALASLFYADAANDVAPSGYNDPEPRPGLPASPLDPPSRPAGFSLEPA